MHSQLPGLSRRTLLFAVFWLYPGAAAQAQYLQQELELLDAQIAALEKGDVDRLKQIPEVDGIVKFTKLWTFQALDTLRKVELPVSHDGAVLLGQFIYVGARRFFKEPEAGVTEKDASNRLDQFVGRLKSLRDEGHRQVDAAMFRAASSICPLWPFC